MKPLALAFVGARPAVAETVGVHPAFVIGPIALAVMLPMFGLVEHLQVVETDTAPVAADVMDVEALRDWTMCLFPDDAVS